jgi:hypothetical protein
MEGQDREAALSGSLSITCDILVYFYLFFTTELAILK